MSGYCEDHPCCGHSRLDPCDGVVILSAGEWAESNYCDDCGYSHLGICSDDDEEPDDE